MYTINVLCAYHYHTNPLCLHDYNAVKRTIPLICGTLVVLMVIVVMLIMGFTLTIKLKKGYTRNTPALQSDSHPSDPIYDEIASDHEVNKAVKYKPSQLTHDDGGIIMLSPNECYQAVRKSTTTQLDRNVAY